MSAENKDKKIQVKSILQKLMDNKKAEKGVVGPFSAKNDLFSADPAFGDPKALKIQYKDNTVTIIQ